MKRTGKWLIAAPLSLLMYAGSAQAITIDFVTEVIFGPFMGETGTASITYDETLLIGAGSESIGPAAGVFALYPDPTFGIDLTMFGQMFSASDDIDFPQYPIVDFFDGDLESVNFIVSEAGVLGPVLNPTDIDRVGLIAFAVSDIQDVPGALPILLIETFGVAEPGTLLLLGLGMFGVARARRS